MEKDLAKEHDELIQKIIDKEEERIMRKDRANHLIHHGLSRIFEEFLMDPEGTFAEPDEDPPMPLVQVAEDADVRQGAIPQELSVNASDRCQIIIKSGARKGSACGRSQPCNRHRSQR